MRLPNPFRREPKRRAAPSTADLQGLYGDAAQAWSRFNGVANSDEALLLKAAGLSSRICNFADFACSTSDGFIAKIRTDWQGTDKLTGAHLAYVFFQMHIAHRTAVAMLNDDQVDLFMASLVAATGKLLSQSSASCDQNGDLYEALLADFNRYTKTFWEFKAEYTDSDASGGTLEWEGAKSIARALGQEWNADVLSTLSIQLHLAPLLLATEALLNP